MRTSRGAWQRWASTTANTSDASSPVLLAFNGKVIAFQAGAHQTFGFNSGDRVRSYAGNRIGQVGVVVGSRNDALWVQFPNEASPESYARSQLHRLDFRTIDHVGFRGLDPLSYKEGDPCTVPLFTGKEVEREARVDSILDDASLQHLVTEGASGRECQRCRKRYDEAEVRSVVEELGEMRHFTERIIRLLLLESADLPPLNSTERIRAAVADATTPDFTRDENEWRWSPEEALASILRQRAAAFDTLCTVRVGTNAFVLPKAVLTLTRSPVTLVGRPWVHHLPNLDALTADPGRYYRHEWTSAPLPLALPSTTASDLIKGVGAEGDVAEVPPHLDANERRLLRAALLLDRGDGKFEPLATPADVAAFLRRHGNEPEVLKAELSRRVDFFRRSTVLRSDVAGGPHSLTVPVAVLASPTDYEVTVTHEPWARSVITSHHAISESKKEGNIAGYLGKRGVVSDTVRAQPFDAIGLSTKLLKQLAAHKGRHLQPVVPMADVYCPDGEFQYLDKACAIELYGEAEEKPTLLFAGGMEEYKSNAWHQPFNMVNDHGLNEFASNYNRSRGYTRKSVFYPRATPAPLG